jgi:hypothetical protein
VPVVPDAFGALWLPWLPWLPLPVVDGRTFIEPLLGWLLRILTLVEGSRFSRLIVVRVRVELSTTGSERRRSMMVVRLGARVAITLVRFFLVATFLPFFFTTVTRDGWSSTRVMWRVRRSTDTSGRDSRVTLTLSRLRVAAEGCERIVADTPAPPLWPEVWPDGADCCDV